MLFDKVLFVLTQKIALMGVAGITAIGGFLAMVHTAPSYQTAIISNTTPTAMTSTVAAPNIATSTIATPSTSTPTITLPNILPDLLASATNVTIPFCTATSTCGKRNLAKLERLQSTSAKKSSTMTTTVATTAMANISIVATPAAATILTPIQQPVPAPAIAITAQSFLANTTYSFKTLFNGTDELIFTTNLGTGNPLTWSLLTTTTDEFSVTSSCSPLPNQPIAGSLDQNPSLNVRTAYHCDVSLTPQSGADERTQTRDFSFTTPPGDFVVMPDNTPNTLLINSANNGGIILKNEDSNPITITSVTFNASYSYLNTLSSIPLIIRFQNPVSDAPLADYTPTNQTSTNITLPLSLIIPPLSQKFLPIQVLGVQKMLVLNTTPSVSIAITGVTIDRSDVKIILNNPNLTWSCEVTSQSYNPNATSGAYVSGQACLQ